MTPNLDAEQTIETATPDVAAPEAAASDTPVDEPDGEAPALTFEEEYPASDIVRKFLKRHEALGCQTAILPAGPERIITVSATNIGISRRREANARYGGAGLSLCPTIIVRERQPDGSLKLLGAFRHVQLLSGSTLEYADKDDRFEKQNGREAKVIQRTYGPIRTFHHPKDKLDAYYAE